MEKDDHSLPAISAEPCDGLSVVSVPDPAFEEVNALLSRLRLSSLVEERLFRERHTLRTAVETHAARIRLLETKWKTSNIELNRATHNLSRLSDDHDRIVTAYKKKCTQAESIALHLQDYQQRFKSVSGERDKLKDDLTQLETSKLEIERKFHQQKETAQTAQSMSHDLANSLEQSKKEQSKLESQIEVLRVGIQNLFDDPVAFIPFCDKPTSQEPSEQLDLLKKSYVKWKAKYDDSVDRYTSSSQAHDKEKSSLLHDVILLQNHVVKLKEECMEFSKERASHLATSESLKGAQESLESLSASHTTLRRNYDEVVNAKENSDDNYKRIVQNLKSHINKLEEEMESQNSRFEEAENLHVKSLHDKIDEIEKKDEEINMLQEEHTSLQNKLAAVERERYKETDDLRAECKALRNKSNQNKKKNDKDTNALRANCKILQDEVSRLELENDKRIDEFHGRIKSLEHEFREIEMKKEEENLILKAECAFLRGETSRIEQKRNEETNKLQAECSSLREKLNHIEKKKVEEIETLRAECSKWRERVEETLTMTTAIGNPPNDGMPVSVNILDAKSGGLISPAPLRERSTYGGTPESRSRYTDQLPFPLDNSNGLFEDLHIPFNEQRAQTRSSDTDKATESCEINVSSEKSIEKQIGSPKFGNKKADNDIFNDIIKLDDTSGEEDEELAGAHDANGDTRPSIRRQVTRNTKPKSFLKQSERHREGVPMGQSVDLEKSADEIDTVFNARTSKPNANSAKETKSKPVRKRATGRKNHVDGKTEISGSSKTISVRNVSETDLFDRTSILNETWQDRTTRSSADAVTEKRGHTNVESAVESGKLQMSLRPRRSISYDYDIEGRDIVGKEQNPQALSSGMSKKVGENDDLHQENGDCIEAQDAKSLKSMRRTESRSLSNQRMRRPREKTYKRRRTTSGDNQRRTKFRKRF